MSFVVKPLCGWVHSILVRAIGIHLTCAYHAFAILFHWKGRMVGCHWLSFEYHWSSLHWILLDNDVSQCTLKAGGLVFNSSGQSSCTLQLVSRQFQYRSHESRLPHGIFREFIKESRILIQQSLLWECAVHRSSLELDVYFINLCNEFQA